MKRAFFTHIYLVMLVVIAVALGCCGRHGAAWRDMDRAERLMAVSPDSAPAALAALVSITPKMLGGSGEKARYALLKSMALDKNYIDKKDFSVLQPAIDYYLTKDKGTADDKLRTYYYQGRIYQNQGDDDAAMQSFMRGRDLGNQVKDTLTLANLMVAQGRIFLSTYKYEDYINVSLEAAKLYHAIGRYDYELMNYADALNGSVSTENKQLADSVMTVSRSIINKNQELSSIITPYILLYTTSFGSKEDVERLVHHYDTIKNLDYVTKSDLANAYCQIGDLQDAKRVFYSIPVSAKQQFPLKYMAVESEVLELNGDYAGALKAYRQFYTTLDSIHKNIFEHDLLFAQQRHKMEKANLLEVQNRNTIIWLCVCAAFILLIVAGFLFYRNRLNKAKKLMAEQENEKLMLKQENLKRENEKLELERQQQSLVEENLRKTNKNLELERRQQKLVEDNLRKTNMNLELERQQQSLVEENLRKTNRNLELERQQQQLVEENLRFRIGELEGEIVSLNDVLKSPGYLAEPIQKAITGRIKMLNGMLASLIANDGSIILPIFRPAERGFKSRISRHREPDSSLG